MASHFANPSPAEASEEAEGRRAASVAGSEDLSLPRILHCREMWNRTKDGMRLIVEAVTGSRLRIPDISLSFSSASKDQLSATLRYPSLHACHAVAERVASSALRESLFSPQVSFLQMERKLETAALSSGSSRRNRALQIAASAVDATFKKLAGAQVRLSSDANLQTAPLISAEVGDADGRVPRLSSTALKNSSSRAKSHSHQHEEEAPPLLVLVGGPSGGGKSSFLPMFLHMLSQTLPELHLSGASSSTDDKLPSSYFVLSTDFLRQVLRTFCADAKSSHGETDLILKSTYRLQGIATAQLQSAAGETSEASSESEASLSEAESVSCRGKKRRMEKRNRNSGNSRRGAFLQEGSIFLERLREELAFIESRLPQSVCPSCGEAVPCSAVLGMLEQALLVQTLALEPLVQHVMELSKNHIPRKEKISDRTDKTDESDANRQTKSRPRLVLVEGIHLTPGFCLRMQRKFGERCLCFTAFCRSKNEHVRRLLRRSASIKQTSPTQNETEERRKRSGETQRNSKDEASAPQLSPESAKSSPALKEGASAEEHVKNIQCIRCAQLFFCLAAEASLENASFKPTSFRHTETQAPPNVFLSEVETEERKDVEREKKKAKKTETAKEMEREKEDKDAGEERGAGLSERAIAASEFPFRAPRIFPLETQDAGLALSVAQQIAKRQWRHILGVKTPSTQRKQPCD